MRNKGIYTILILALIIALGVCHTHNANAYYGMYGGLYGMGPYGMLGSLLTSPTTTTTMPAITAAATI